jgi:lipid-binding SYLF domain-containing protein
LRTLLPKARAVLICPQLLRGAFIIGVSGGSGVLLVRDTATGQWGGPAFYTIGQASFGLQAGGDASEVLLVALTDRGVSALLSTSAKLGADASIALGPVGWGAEAATQNLSADIVGYSLSQGLYAGLSLDGAVVATRGALNQAYYGKAMTPIQILIQREASNPQAARLIEDVAEVAGGSGPVRTSVKPNGAANVLAGSLGGASEEPLPWSDGKISPRVFRVLPRPQPADRWH